MRSISLTLCVLAVMAAALTTVPAALAESAPATAAATPTGTGAGPATDFGSGARSDRGTGSGTGSDTSGSGTSLTVTPSVVAPGGEVALRLDGCGGKGAEGGSDAFVSQARFTPAADGGLFARAWIGADVVPGDHDIRVVCADGTDGATGTVTVAVAGRAAAASPLAPVRAGGGGTAVLTDREARRSGPGVAHAVIGLTLAAVTVTAFVLRSATRRRRRGAD
ncbi:hypothetical protein [Streptomyces sp. NPDC052042]|uniref:hypothetical protein n=1 Tax=Streptomyces sp. NPDC052042 TaxID=3365683 RepID=UPI0037D2D676